MYFHVHIDGSEILACLCSKDQISEEQDGEGEGGEGEEEGEGEGEGEGKSGVSLVVPLALGGCLLILIATIGTIKLLHCRKRR